MKNIIKSCVIVCLIFNAIASQGVPIPINNASQLYQQNFDSTFGSTNEPWVDASTIEGWSLALSKNGVDSVVNDVTAVNDGGGFNLGVISHFGANASSERALGAVNGALPLTEAAYGANFSIMNITEPINSVRVSYKGEQWSMLGNSQTIQFFYRKGGNQFSAVDNIGWTPVPSLNFTSLKSGGLPAALDGNTDFINIESQIDLSADPLNSGDSFWIRWFDENNGAFGESGLAIDNLEVEFSTNIVLPPDLTGFQIDLKKPNVSKTLEFSSAKGFSVKGNIITTNAVTKVSYAAFGAGGTPTVFIDAIQLTEIAANKKLFKQKGVKYKFNSKENKAGIGIVTGPVTLIVRVEGSQGANTGAFHTTNIFSNVKIK